MRVNLLSSEGGCFLCPLSSGSWAKVLSEVGTLTENLAIMKAFIPLLRKNESTSERKCANSSFSHLSFTLQWQCLAPVSGNHKVVTLLSPNNVSKSRSYRTQMKLHLFKEAFLAYAKPELLVCFPPIFHLLDVHTALFVLLFDLQYSYSCLSN